MTPRLLAIFARLADVGLCLVGAGLIVAGVARWSGATAMIVAGVGLLAAGLWRPGPFLRRGQGGRA